MALIFVVMIQKLVFPVSLVLIHQDPHPQLKKVKGISHPNGSLAQVSAPATLLASLAWPFHQQPPATVARHTDTQGPVVISDRHHNETTGIWTNWGGSEGSEGEGVMEQPERSFSPTSWCRHRPGTPGESHSLLPSALCRRL